MRSYRALMVVLVLALVYISGIVSAQGPGAWNEFLSNPHGAKVVTTDPSNTQTTASKILTYTGQPTAGDLLVVRAPGGSSETYEFYSGTYTGSHTGVKIADTMDNTYTTFTTVITANSNIIKSVTSTGGNTVTLRYKYSGDNGNLARVDSTDVHNITSYSGVFAGGASPAAGTAGATLYNKTNNTLWIKTVASVDRDAVTYVWRRINGPSVSNFNTIALTSPTATFSVNSLIGDDVSLSADANLTGAYPTDGYVGQIVRIHAATGAGTNTIRFDDNGSTFSLGGNITLTEGNNDVLTLECRIAKGTNSRSVWDCISAHTN